MLRTVEMQTLRTMTWKTLRDSVRNDEIRKICGLENVVRAKGKGGATGSIMLKV